MELLAEELLDDEQLEVWRKRYTEAATSGMDHFDASLFAWSDTDVGKVRDLVSRGCPAALIAQIVL